MDVIIPKSKDPPPKEDEGRIDLLVAHYITLDLWNPEAFVGLNRHLSDNPISAMPERGVAKDRDLGPNHYKIGVPSEFLRLLPITDTGGPKCYPASVRSQHQNFALETCCSGFAPLFSLSNASTQMTYNCDDMSRHGRGG